MVSQVKAHLRRNQHHRMLSPRALTSNANYGLRNTAGPKSRDHCPVLTSDDIRDWACLYGTCPSSSDWATQASV